MISHLIERVESASGPDREIDGLIEVTFGLVPEGAFWLPGLQEWATGAHTYHKLPHYTASLDAVVALIEAKMPGYDYAVGVIDGIPFGDVGPQSSFEMVSVKHKTPALSLLASFLRAWKEQNNER